VGQPVRFCERAGMRAAPDAAQCEIGYGGAVTLAILLSALAMTAIVGVRYLLASGGFALATRLRHPGLYRG
ncbi:hypothetical protein, partial [Morganella morganii]|uniref:hypothetical protein n=1 Tax=Morganella morganii TaxID=582 RepID=UPI001954BA30